MLVLTSWCLKDRDKHLNIKKDNEIEKIYISVYKSIKPSICLWSLTRLKTIEKGDFREKIKAAR